MIFNEAIKSKDIEDIKFKMFNSGTTSGDSDPQCSFPPRLDDCEATLSSVKTDRFVKATRVGSNLLSIGKVKKTTGLSKNL